MQRVPCANLQAEQEHYMDTELENGAVLNKTRELCEVLVNQPAFANLRRGIDAFMADESARRLYQLVAEKSEALNHKQQMGTLVTRDEIASFEQERNALLRNDVARAFIEAQDQMQRVQQTVTRYINKTIELGRVPCPEDLMTCGHGCNCGH